MGAKFRVMRRTAVVQFERDSAADCRPLGQPISCFDFCGRLRFRSERPFELLDKHLMLIDCHHHLWTYSAEQYGWISDDMSRLTRDFLAPELHSIARNAASKDAASNDAAVTGFVSVQARQSLQETDELLDIAASERLIRGVVGWVPLAAADIQDVLDRYAGAELLKGVRHVVQDEPDDRFLLGRDFNRGVGQLKDRGLVYDILILARQLPAAIEFANQHPAQPFVLNHIAKPEIKKSEFDRTWEFHLRELAKHDNMTCKFSGIATQVRDETWDIETLRPYWDVALDAFGPQRLMYASDWPVCLLACEYQRWLTVVRELASELSPSEQADFFANNAIRVYGL